MRIFARLDFSQSGEVLTIFWVETKILISHRKVPRLFRHVEHIRNFRGMMIPKIATPEIDIFIHRAKVRVGMQLTLYYIIHIYQKVYNYQSLNEGTFSTKVWLNLSFDNTGLL